MVDRTEDLGTYEMLWDCPACGTEKLLGVTHRFCPACGSPQDPNARYFPSDADKVAVSDHRYHGADLVCSACTMPNAANANNCVACGAPLAGSKQAGMRQDVVLGDGQQYGGQTGADARAEMRQQRADQVAQAQGKLTATQQEAEGAKKKKRRVVGGVLGGVGAIAAGTVGVVLWKKEVDLEVVGHRWERTIVIEEYGPVEDSAWCNEMPSKAYSVSRKKEVRSHDKVPDGEKCTTRKVDKGNGTFSEKRECKTKYRKEPVYDQKCYYTIDRWHQERVAKAEGQSIQDEPAWPDFKLEKEGQCKGCEREGSRAETYVVVLQNPEGETHDCDFSESDWRGYEVGSEWKAAAGVVTGGLDCSSLEQR
jgi:hypothetical protein